MQVVSDDLYLVKLGILRDIDQEIHIAIEVKQRKNHLGSAGVFVGFREHPFDNMREFQAIRLLQASSGVSCSRRTVNRFHPDTPNSRVLISFPDIRLDVVPQVGILTLKISHGKLKQVLWNGLIVEEISSTMVGEADGSDVSGMFGVFADKCVAVFSSYELNNELQELKSSK